MHRTTRSRSICLWPSFPGASVKGKRERDRGVVWEVGKVERQKTGGEMWLTGAEDAGRWREVDWRLGFKRRHGGAFREKEMCGRWLVAPGLLFECIFNVASGWWIPPRNVITYQLTQWKPLVFCIHDSWWRDATEKGRRRRKSGIDLRWMIRQCLCLVIILGDLFIELRNPTDNARCTFTLMFWTRSCCCVSLKRHHHFF